MVRVADVAPAMFVKFMLSVDDCHWIVVALPVKVRFAGDVPLQMV